MPKLKTDFGVSALLGTLIVVGAFTVIIIGLLTRQVDVAYVMVLLASWVSAVVSAYLVVKSAKESKTSQNNKE